MIFDKEGSTTIIHQEKVSVSEFVHRLELDYNRVKNDHLIINLFSFKALRASDLLEFMEVSRRHKSGRKSFVLVTDKIGYDEVPEEISLAPTLQEAKDLIEMEEIERDLEL